jgi:peptidoglycan/LPS O-acetylase OafA/YrhL
VAVGLVLIFHVQPGWVPGGFIGVDVFFVVSGFLIIGHLLEGVARGRIDVIGFWARRIRRLLPASMLVLVVSALATILVIPNAVWRSTFTQLAASALYVQNWVLARDAVDYLAADDAPSIAQHFWSLSVEEQFYVIVPLLIALVVAVWGRSRRAVFTVLAILAVLSLAWSVWLTATDSSTAYFASTTRA